ncbi:MAG TPA: glycosyltransferase family 2 protein, partial [Bryobacteraceae bacterium]
GPQTFGKVTFDYHTLLFGAMAILIGFQSINFAVFTKMFAVREHLLPEDPALTKAFRCVTLETGLILGTLLIFAGAATWILGLSYWRSHHFGPLDPDKTLRIVIPGFVSLTLGIEIVLSSFFLSVLGMARR